MSSDHDAAEFIDDDFQSRKSPFSVAASGGPGQPAPTRQEVDAELARTQEKLAAILREKELKERERAALEDTRRRQTEFQTGRQEMIQHLTRGVGLLQEAEFSARRDADQMTKSLTDLRTALDKIQSIHEEAWTTDNFSVELTRALTTLENARLEWNAARLKYTVLAGQPQQPEPAGTRPAIPTPTILGNYSFGEMCRLGFALTWPVAAVLLGLGVLLAALLRH
jgi:hypothetical protein